MKRQMGIHVAGRRRRVKKRGDSVDRAEPEEHNRVENTVEKRWDERRIAISGR